MDRYAMNDGPLVEVLAELEDLCAGARPEKAAAYKTAIEKIKAGADAVRVGDQAWRVIDWADV